MSKRTTEHAARRSKAGVIWLAFAWYVVSCLGSNLLQPVPTAAQQASPALDPPAQPADTNAGGDLVGDLGAPATGAAKSPPKPKFGQKEDLDAILAWPGSLQVRAGTLDEWLMAIMQTWPIDIRYNPEELNKVSYAGQFTDQPLQEILDTMLNDSGFGYRKGANGISIMRQEDISKHTKQHRFEVIPMEYSNPSEVLPTLTFLLSPKGSVQALPSSKAMTVMDFPENIELVRAYVDKLEKMGRETAERQQALERQQRGQELPQDAANATQGQGSTPVQPVEQTKYTVIPIQFLSADALTEAIQTQITDVTVTVIEGENKLLVSGPESSLLSVAQLIRAIDTPRKQVRVSIKMYDVSIEALEQLGVNWRSAGKGRLDDSLVPNTLGDLHTAPMQLGSSSTSTTTGTSTSTGTTTGTTTASGSGYPSTSTFLSSVSPPLLGSALNLYHISKYFDVNAVILALDQTTGARLLASPVQTVADRTECEIKIITEIPVQQLTQTSDGGQIGTTTFREAGTTMKVMPWICNDGSVVLTVAPEFSLLRGFNGVQPIIDRRTSKTVVRVMSGDTFVLGGLRRRNENEVVSGIPGLMNIKYLGAIFRAHRTTVTESELLIFIQTEIIDVDYHGEPREQVASQIVGETLEHIPYASHAPFIPPCNDPYCPYHNPRPRIWTGNVLAPEPPYPHDGGVHDLRNGVPANGHAHPEHPQHQHSHPEHPQEHLPPKPPAEDSPPALRQTPPPPQPGPQNSAIRKPSLDATPLPAEPPPVMIDETARRPGSYRMTYRLPKVTEEIPNPSVNSTVPPRDNQFVPSQQPAMATQKKSFLSDLLR